MVTESGANMGSATAEVSGAAQSEIDMSLSRRLDWRFLLPSPELLRVLWVGSVDNDLHESLAHFCGDLSTISADDSLQDDSFPVEHFDLLVVGDVERQAMVQGLRWLKPGGSIYWEIRRKKSAAWTRGRFGLTRAGAFSAHLRALGVGECSVYWHRPSFAKCLEIIPLDRRQAIEHALRQSRVGFKGMLKFVGGHALLRSGLIEFLIPCFSVVGTKR